MSDQAIQSLIRRWRTTQDPNDAQALAAAVSRAKTGHAFGMVTIPKLGTVFTLVEPWEFDLWGEARNHTFWETIHGRDESKYVFGYWIHPKIPNPPRWRGEEDMAAIKTTLPAGTKLKVARIYIRACGDTDFDSVTFTVEIPQPQSDPEPGKKAKQVKPKKGRFWAKLGDVNRILCEFDESTITRKFEPSGKRKY